MNKKIIQVDMFYTVGLHVFFLFRDYTNMTFFLKRKHRSMELWGKNDMKYLDCSIILTRTTSGIVGNVRNC